MTQEGTATERTRMRPARCRMRAVAEGGLTTATNGVMGDAVAQVEKQRAVPAVVVATGARGRGVKHPYRCRSPALSICWVRVRQEERLHALGKLSGATRALPSRQGSRYVLLRWARERHEGPEAGLHG
jgi:ferredoxin